MMPGGPAEEFAETDAVFSGEVTRVIEDEAAYSMNVQMKVSKQWKGLDFSEGTLIELETPNNSASCGVNFVKGEEYLVYGFEDEETGELHALLCSRTTQMENADEDLAYLETKEREEPQDRYSDVRASTRYSEAILRLSDDGVFQGYANGMFRPQATVNRAEFVKILTASLYAPEDIASCPQQADFAYVLRDVRDEDWYNPYVCKARLKGLVEGYPDRTFLPAEAINFAEAAKIVAGAFGVDIEVQGSMEWYRPAVDALIAKNAVPQTVRGPGHLITRGEMAEIIFRLRYNVTDRLSASF